MKLSFPCLVAVFAAIDLGSVQAGNDNNCCLHSDCPLKQACSGANCEGANPTSGVCVDGCCSTTDCPAEESLCSGACCESSECSPIEFGTCGSASCDLNLCFSADATVQVLDKGQVAMKDLLVGDQVVTDAWSLKYETVYAFGHWNPTPKEDFVKIVTSLPHAIELTKDHLIKVDGSFVKASSVKVGDILEGDHNVPVKVTKIKPIVHKDGIYAPLTPSGTLLVDGVVASSYVSLQDKGNKYPVFANGMVLPISQQFVSHMFMAPFRMLCMGVSSLFCDIRTKEGVAFWVDWGLKLAEYADKQTLLVQILLLVVALVLILPFYAMECLLGARNAPTVILTLGLALAWAETSMRSEKLE